MKTLQRVFAGVALLALLPWLGFADTASPLTKTPYDFVYLGEGRPVLYRLHVYLDGKPLETAWEEFVQHVFDTLDTDKGGVLTRDEAERTPPTAALFAGNQIGGNFGTPTLTQMDKNNDGKVTRDELGRYYRTTGAAPFQMQMGQAQNAQYVELLGRSSRQPSGGGDVLNQRLFQLLDADRDGKLSAEELTAAPAILLRRDADDDEMVGSNELVSTPVASDYAFAVQSLAMEQRQPTPGAFLAITPGETMTFARQLLNRYADRKTKKPSTNLTREAIRLDEKTFNQLDVDGNGELDAEELTRFADRPADVELIVRLGKVANGQTAVEIVAKPDRDPSLAASLKTRTSGAVLDLGTTRLDFTTLSQGSDVRFNVSNKQIYQMQFTRADQDNNGYLDRAEAQRNGFFQSMFRAMDRDGDGMLFEKEVLAYLDQLEGLQAKATAGCCALNVADQGKGLFDYLDTNRDGRLSVREMRAAVKQIENLDRNGDKTIGQDEIPRNYQMTLRRGGIGSGDGPVRRVVVANSFSSGGSSPAASTAGPVWFRKMDRNRDGDVSQREFLGTSEEFKRLDTDNDGLISVQEAERAGAKKD